MKKQVVLLLASFERKDQNRQGDSVSICNAKQNLQWKSFHRFCSLSVYRSEPEAELLSFPNSCCRIPATAVQKF